MASRTRSKAPIFCFDDDNAGGQQDDRGYRRLRGGRCEALKVFKWCAKLFGSPGHVEGAEAQATATSIEHHVARISIIFRIRHPVLHRALVVYVAPPRATHPRDPGNDDRPGVTRYGGLRSCSLVRWEARWSNSWNRGLLSGGARGTSR